MSSWAVIGRVGVLCLCNGDDGDFDCDAVVIWTERNCDEFGVVSEKYRARVVDVVGLEFECTQHVVPSPWLFGCAREGPSPSSHGFGGCE